MKLSKNFFLALILIVVVCSLQFIIGRKHLEYGFNNDDWYVLAWYQEVVDDPVKDVMKAWKAIGAHNFAHAYYIGPLFELFKFNYPLYHIFNTLLKALAGLSIFPLIFFLFKNKFLATMTTIIFAIHFTPFGGMNNVLIGEDSLMLVSINLYLALYVWASKKKLLNNPKVLFSLFGLILAAAAFDITRSYPFIMVLPLIEVVNYSVNKPSASIKDIILRLLFFYSPFFAVIIYSPNAAINEFTLNKINYIFRTGNYQLFLSLFASFGSVFAPIGVTEFFGNFGRMGNNILYAKLENFLSFFFFRYLLIALPVLVTMGFLTVINVRRFVLRAIVVNAIVSLLAFFSANHWMILDPKLQAGVDPGIYFTPGLLGLFIFSTSVAFLMEWYREKNNYFLLALSISSISALLYTFLTWMLVSENAIFTGVHGYLSVAAIGACIYLAIILYIAFLKISSNKAKLSQKLAASFTIVYFLVFIFASYKQVDDFYAYWVANGFKAKDQENIQNSFWKEVGFNKPSDDSRTLVYLDGTKDYENGSFYASTLIWDIPAMLTVRRGEPFESNGFCNTVVTKVDLDKIKIETINGEKVITQVACGDKKVYKLENFYAFMLINRNAVSIRSEILKELEGE